MTRLSRAKRFGLASGLGAVGLGWVLLAVRDGHSAEPAQGAQPPNLYVGSQTCTSCHNVTPRLPQTPYVESLKFIKLNEYDTWRNQDKHSLAYRNLLDPRGREIGRRLNVDVTKAEAGCLGCHSAGTVELKNRVLGNLFNRDEGVSCENCHGPSSNWGFNHALGQLRLLPAEERAQKGLIDLRTAEHQSNQCLSCHVGNVAEEKVVTHAMYAAGHPPLPSVEIATFSDVIPRHWYLPGERTDPTVRASLKTPVGQADRTKLAVVGAAVALRTALNLIADEATGAGPLKAPGQTWPDYARFDCYACHHELKRESWRQERGYTGPPGRPMLNEWPLALVELGIERLAMDDPAAKAFRTELKQMRSALMQPVEDRPFGRGKQVGQAARDFAKWTNLLIARLEASSYDRKTSGKLLRLLLDGASQGTLDYDAARHLGWAIRTLIRDLGPDLPNRDAIDRAVAALTDQLDLDLPAGREKTIEGNLPRAMKRAADYDPAPFRAQVAALADLLPRD